MRAQLYELLNIIQPFIGGLYSSRLRVLAYHKVPGKEAFDRQVAYLKSNYNLVSVEDLQAHFKGKKKLPKKPVLISFDDGDVSVYDNGLPVLQKYEVPSCLFIITSLINTNQEVWIKCVESGEMARGRSYYEARKVVNYFKSLKNADRVRAMKDYRNISTRQLSSEQLIILKDSGMFIANHSHTHPMFDKCSEEEIVQEMQNTKQFFQAQQLEGYSVFAYPNGNADESSQRILLESGIDMIFLFDHKINPKTTDPKRISRIKVDTDTPLSEFKTKVSGVHPLILRLKNRL